jgi:oligoribonuclease
MAVRHQSKLIWIDLEMTGLKPEEHVILEIASVITDDQLGIVAEGPNIAVNVRGEDLDNMEDWSRVHHEESGLLDRVRNSPDDCRSAEEKTLEFLYGYCDKEESPLCGNSVGQDRRFLYRHMPRLEAFLHYRNIDVSSIKELVKRWYPHLRPFQKQKSHLALDDIKESIEELKYYRQQVFLPQIK